MMKILICVLLMIGATWAWNQPMEEGSDFQLSVKPNLIGEIRAKRSSNLELIKLRSWVSCTKDTGYVPCKVEAKSYCKSSYLASATTLRPCYKALQNGVYSLWCVFPKGINRYNICCDFICPSPIG
ncbi:uncharacterized protein [Clytia hemisphaerica]|uniref:Uncharacterized protein n=1 Tax=Clytia hemisphaerica TaxID=252671 RepID=A0A7M5VF85_9CNID|eukprot:TCONS_00038609-protein